MVKLSACGAAGLLARYLLAATSPVPIHNCKPANCADEVRNKPGVECASEYTSPSGKKYLGHNRHGQQAEGALADALDRVNHYGGCAEVHCLIQAQAAEGPELSGWDDAHTADAEQFHVEVQYDWAR